MALYPYSIAVGWNAASSMIAVEGICQYTPHVIGAPRAVGVPLGSIRRTTLNQNVQTNGTKIIQWTFDAISFQSAQAWINFVFGGFETENTNVTIRTRKRDNTFANYNAVAILPIEGPDYMRRFNGHMQNLVQTFRDLQAI